MDNRYFESEKYKSSHMHIDNWEPFWTEAIAWERLDGSWDVIFYDFQSQEEFYLLFGTKEHYKDEVGGVFLFNAKTYEECTEKFIKWVYSNLLPIRTRK